MQAMSAHRSLASLVRSIDSEKASRRSCDALPWSRVNGPPAGRFASATMLKLTTWILLRVGLGLPHQSGSELKSSDWSAVWADILYAPVPTSVSGLLHQFSK